MVGIRSSLAGLFFVAWFCVNLQKEVTAGCLANGDNAQRGSSMLEYKSLQISRVFILGLIRLHPSPPSSPSAFFFFSCLSNPSSPVSPLHQNLSSLCTLLSPHHSLSLICSLSLIFLRCGIGEGGVFHSLVVCSFFSSLFICVLSSPEVTCQILPKQEKF